MSTQADSFFALLRAALFFSDTSGAAKSNSAAATKEAYHEGINPIFSAKTVPELCGQYKAFKQAPKSKRAKAGDPETLGLTRPGMNLHFFRAGINPTWEDPYNEKVRLPLFALSRSSCAAARGLTRLPLLLLAGRSHHHFPLRRPL